MIDKFAISEAKSILATHAKLMFTWSQTPSTPITSELKDALMASVMRMFEVIEEIPVADYKPAKNVKGDILSA